MSKKRAFLFILGSISSQKSSLLLMTESLSESSSRSRSLCRLLRLSLDLGFFFSPSSLSTSMSSLSYILLILNFSYCSILELDKAIPLIEGLVVRRFSISSNPRTSPSSSYLYCAIVLNRKLSLLGSLVASFSLRFASFWRASSAIF